MDFLKLETERISSDQNNDDCDNCNGSGFGDCLPSGDIDACRICRGSGKRYNSYEDYVEYRYGGSIEYISIEIKI